jgi:predicted deacylase
MLLVVGDNSGSSSHFIFQFAIPCLIYAAMKQHGTERVVVDYSMGKPGPLVVVVGAMHGNEPAGVAALARLSAMLKAEPSLNPGFQFKGRLVGIIGNMQAFSQEKRFIDRDLNRIWDDLPPAQTCAECAEVSELQPLIHDLVTAHSGSEILILDLHTTSAEGGIFSITLEGKRAEKLAQLLHAPVVKGLLHGMTGTFLHYCKGLELPGTKIAAVAFEAGQHNDPTSVDRAVAAIVHGLRGIGCIRAKDVNHAHNELLIRYSKSLPKVVTLDYIHKIKPEDQFVMRPGYRHFQHVKQGEPLADDRFGPILCKTDGMILMPLYQKLGGDGFCIVV